MDGAPRKTLGIAGLLVLLMAAGLTLTLYLDARHARKLDHRRFVGFFAKFKPCDPRLLSLSVSQRVMSEAESQVLTVVLSNHDTIDRTPLNGPEECKATIALAAPDFTLGPSETSQTVLVPLGTSTRVAWVLSPKKPGTFRVVAFLQPVTPVSDSAQIGITVHTVLGLTPIQVYLLSIVGYVLGPILSISYWVQIIAQWRTRRAIVALARETSTQVEPRASNSSSVPAERKQVAPGPKNRLL
jgi:hypothetical protein